MAERDPKLPLLSFNDEFNSDEYVAERGQPVADPKIFSRFDEGNEHIIPTPYAEKDEESAAQEAEAQKVPAEEDKPEDQVGFSIPIDPTLEEGDEDDGDGFHIPHVAGGEGAKEEAGENKAEGKAPPEGLAKNDDVAKIETPAELPEWIARIRDDAWHHGFEAGTKNGRHIGKREQSGRGEDSSLTACGRQVETLLNELQTAERKRDFHVMELMIDILEKILPAVSAHNAEDEIKYFVEGILHRLNFKRKISIILPSGSDGLKEQIKSVVTPAIPAGDSFDDRVAFGEDASFGPVDCRVEWDHGQIERRVEAIWQELKETLQQHAPEKGEAETLTG